MKKKSSDERERVRIVVVVRCCTLHVLEWQYRRWDKLRGDTEFRSYYVARCNRCDELLLYINDPPHDDICDNFEGSEPEADTVLVWPKLAVSGEAVPEQVRNCYSEAIAVRKRSLNSFATNIRRALEAVCEDRGIVKTPLSKSLQKLAFSDQLAPRLNEITDVLRFVGNVGAHNDRGVTQGEAEVIDNCFRLLVEYFYEVPDQIRRLRRIVADVAENQLEEAGDSASKPPETGKLQ